jgi:hypothetical protein
LIRMYSTSSGPLKTRFDNQFPIFIKSSSGQQQRLHAQAPSSQVDPPLGYERHLLSRSLAVEFAPRHRNRDDSWHYLAPPGSFGSAQMNSSMTYPTDSYAEGCLHQLNWANHDPGS